MNLKIKTRREKFTYIMSLLYDYHYLYKLKYISNDVCVCVNDTNARHQYETSVTDGIL